jgi:hypothetical protein
MDRVFSLVWANCNTGGDNTKIKSDPVNYNPFTTANDFSTWSVGEM